ncbi:MAG: hypothetical protein RBJ76_13175 [Stenomitos frigidus ULC029]
MSFRTPTAQLNRYQIIEQLVCTRLGKEYFQADVINTVERQTLEVKRYLATGSQIKSQATKSEQVTQVWSVPATWFDALKQALIEWQPTLYFGWLRPELRQLPQLVEVTEHATYLNVFPLPLQLAQQNKDLALRRIAPMEVTPDAWLDGEPFTRQDWEAAKGEIGRKLTSIELAEFLAFYHVNGGRN